MGRDMRCIRQLRLIKLSTRLIWCHPSSRIKEAKKIAEKAAAKHHLLVEALRSSPKLHWESLAGHLRSTISMLAIIPIMKDTIWTWMLTKNWISWSMSTEWRMKELLQKSMIWKIDWQPVKTEEVDASLLAKPSPLTPKASKITMARTSLAWMTVVHSRAKSRETLKIHTGIRCLPKDDVIRHRCIKLFEQYFICLQIRLRGWSNLANTTLF